MNVFKGKGTPGIGDAMLYMNVAHRYAHDNNVQVELQLHWDHDKDFKYHFEDPETIVERVDYLHKFYYKNHLVTIKHIFNSKPAHLWKYRMTLNDKVCIFHEDHKEDKWPLKINWKFHNNFSQRPMKNKVVIWRSLFNAEPPRKWKRFTNQKAVDSLRKSGYNVIELSYRSPIREVMWHINTADLLVGYDGMWHHVGQLFFKPMLIVSMDTITTKFTPGAYNVSNGKEHNYLNVIKDPHKLQRLYNRAKRYEDKFKNRIP